MTDDIINILQIIKEDVHNQFNTLVVSQRDLLIKLDKINDVVTHITTTFGQRLTACEVKINELIEFRKRSDKSDTVLKNYFERIHYKLEKMDNEFNHAKEIRVGGLFKLITDIILRKRV